MYHAVTGVTPTGRHELLLEFDNGEHRLFVEDGLIEYTIPDKPNSRLQKYRLTGKGRREARYG